MGMNNIVFTLFYNFPYFAKSEKITERRDVPFKMRSCNDIKVPLLCKAE